MNFRISKNIDVRFFACYNKYMEVIYVLIENGLKELIDKRFNNVKTFADEIELPYTTVRSILERGVLNSKVENVIKIAEGLNLDPKDLLTFDRKELREANPINSIYDKLNFERQQKVYEFATSQLKDQNKTVQLNQELFDIEVAQKVAAGHKNNGIVHLDNKTNYNVQVPINEVPPKYDIAFEVAGQSMEPFFQDGQIVFVEQQEAYDGMLGVVIIDGQAFLKRIKIEDNLLRLISMNKEDDSFKDIIVTPECDIQIVGRVVM